jgi:hypothetical protein
MQTLADLSRVKPTGDELEQIFKLLESESDRGCALIAGCLLENVLEIAIAAFTADCGKVFYQSIFAGNDAPMATFSAKIRMGRALSIYGEITQTRFGLVKDIRNAFAHALRPLDFNHPTIVEACKGLAKRPLPKPDGNLAPARIRYIAFCYSMSMHLYQIAELHGGQEQEIKLTEAD